MQLPNSSLLSVRQTKSGQTTRQGTKTGKITSKAVKKPQTQKKELPQQVKPLSEAEQIIRAAENYHRMMSGDKSTEKEKSTVNQPKILPQNVAPAAVKNSVVNVSPVVTPNVNTISYEKPTFQVRDPEMNIFLGNPGVYKTEGDTLNFWSFSSQQDTLPQVVSTQQVANQPYGFEGKPIKASGQDWPFALIMLGWVIFASLRFGFSKYLFQVVQSIFSYSAASRLFREHGYSSNFGKFRMNLLFLSQVPLSIYFIAKDNGAAPAGSSGIEFFLIIFAAVNGYFLLKLLLYKMLGSIFSKKDSTGELIFNMMLYYNMLGLVLLFNTTFHAMVPIYATFSLFVVPVIIGIFYLMSIIRSIYFAIKEGISIFYLILYLCALEILPILLLVKFAMKG